MTAPKTEQRSIIERHTQTVLTFIITALIGWVGLSVSTQRTEIALLQQSVNSLQTQVTNFTNYPRFTASDFEREMRLYDRRLDDLEELLKKKNERIAETQSRLKTIEKKLLIQ